jgi:hypothetical protein
MGPRHSLDQHLNLATALFMAMEPCRYHFGIVKHQQITHLHMVYKIAKLPMLQSLSRRI